jgi:hypothetical protein
MPDPLKNTKPSLIWRTRWARYPLLNLTNVGAGLVPAQTYLVTSGRVQDLPLPKSELFVHDKIKFQ